MITSKADKYFSLFIRIRDTEDGLCRCITCGRLAHPKEMDCGHYLKRQHQATRFSEINTAAQCGKCNRFEQGRDVIFRQRLIERYGEAKIVLLEEAARKSVKRTKTELDAIADYYKLKAKKLSKEKGIPIW
jgi:hypothetical protein